MNQILTIQMDHNSFFKIFFDIIDDISIRNPQKNL